MKKTGFVNRFKTIGLCVFLVLFSNVLSAEILYWTTYNAGKHSSKESACSSAGAEYVAEYNLAPLYGYPKKLVATGLAPYYSSFRCSITTTSYTGATTTTFNDFGSCDTALNADNSCYEIPKTFGPQCPSPDVSNPVNSRTGNKSLTETDLQPAGLSMLGFKRFYNSEEIIWKQKVLYAKDGVLGTGWQHNYEVFIELIGGDRATITLVMQGGVRYRFVSTGTGGWLADADADTQYKLLETTTGWDLKTRAGKMYSFDTAGRLNSINNEAGRLQTLQYSATGELASVSDDVGQQLVFGYSATTGLLESVTHLPSNRAWNYRYDANLNLEFVDNPDGTSRQYHYEDVNFVKALTGITDERSIRYATYGYDVVGRAISTEHAGGAEKVTLNYNADITTTITNSRSFNTGYTYKTQFGVPMVDTNAGPGCVNCGTRNVQYQYDPANSNVLSKTVDGVTTQYGNYDANGNKGYKIESAGTPETRRIDYTYDPRFTNKVRTITEPSVFAGGFKVTSHIYNPNADITYTSVYGYKPDGTQISRTTTYQYNGPLNQISKIDGPRTDINDTTTFNYYPDDATQGNNRARLQNLIAANGLLLRDNITYTATGKVDTEDRLNNLAIDYNYYVGNDRLQEIIQTNTLNLTTRITRWTYLPTGEVASVTQGAGSANATTLSFTYDNARRLTRTTDGLGNYTEYTLDTEGNVLNDNIYDANGALKKTLAQTYGAYNRLKAFSQLNEKRDSKFNTDGTLDTVTDGKGVVSQYAYDSLKRLTKITQDQFGTNPTTANALTQYAYDVQDNLTSVTDANTGQTRYVYDDLGNLLSRTSPDTGTVSYQYDRAGNVVRTIDAKGQVLNYIYDALNRVTAVDGPVNSDDSVYIYDTCKNGSARLCEINNNQANVQYQYNPFGGVKKHQSITYAYNEANRIKTINYPSGAIVTYLYDVVGDVRRIQLTVNGAVQNIVSNVTHLPFGTVNGLLYANGKTLRQTFDTAYRMRSSDVASVMTYNYTLYDENGNLKQIQDILAAKINDYFYDELNRLNTANGSFGSLIFDYDKVGNRTRLTDTGVSDYLYEPNSNRITQIGLDNISLDANGNITSSNTYSYIYNTKNQLRLIKNKLNTKITTYKYNDLGQRVRKQNNKTAKFSYGLNGELMVETSGLKSKEYIYLDGQLIAFTDNTLTSSNAASVVLSSDPVLKGNSVSIDWSGVVTPTATDWVAVYAVGAINTNMLDWAYTDGSNSGTINMRLNNSAYIAGAGYEVRLFANDSYTLLATSRKFTLNPTGTSIRNLTTDALQGGAIEIAWNGITAPTGFDWVGIYTPGASDAAFVSWVYTDGSDSGGASLALNAAGLVAGQTYEMRLYANDGFTKLATSEPFILLSSNSVTVDSSVYYIHNDHLGTPKSLTDSTGQLVWHSTTYPFGKASVNADVDGDGVAVEFNIRQPGQYYDIESGLYYNYFRYYDPETGRYITSDPIGLLGGINTYAYVGNNPLKFVDLLGLNKCSCISTSGGGGNSKTINGIKQFNYNCRCTGTEESGTAGCSASFSTSGGSDGGNDSNGQVGLGADYATGTASDGRTYVYATGFDYFNVNTKAPWYQFWDRGEGTLNKNIDDKMKEECDSCK